MWPEEDSEGHNHLLLASIVVGGIGCGIALHQQRQRQEKQLAEMRLLIPSLLGKIAVVTGANTGVGEVVARELARANAKVEMGW